VAEGRRKPILRPLGSSRFLSRLHEFCVARVPAIAP
jgi:hypothetical protein